MSSSSSDPYFIHFGCWNNGGCPNENAMTQVLHAIKTRPIPPQFLSICGDNYYPQKAKDAFGNKQKTYQYDQLLSGFQCLPNLPIYMTFGNHDFETNLRVADSSTVENTCTLTNQELQLVKEQYPNIQLELFQAATFQNARLLFLDTTLYDPDDIDEYLQCYRAVNPVYVDIDTIKQAQLQFIRTFVAYIQNSPADVNTVIVIGHHPLAQFKEKKGKVRFAVLNEEFNELLYQELYVPLRKTMQYYYMCADLHQYQCGNVVIRGEMQIRQYIVGTGGAEKDAYSLTVPRTDEVYNIKYSMSQEDIDQSCAENGYLTCTAMNGRLDMAFVKVPAIRGGAKRTNKKMNMKNKKKE